jgi:hypothetical protein
MLVGAILDSVVNALLKKIAAQEERMPDWRKPRLFMAEHRAGDWLA